MNLSGLRPDGQTGKTAGSDGKDIAKQANGSTAITLLYFEAKADTSGNVVLTWETATKIDNAGFNIYRARRSEDGTYKKINDTLIPAQGNATSGASYSYVDTPPAKGTYYYKLEDIDYNGVSTMHGPGKGEGEVGE